MKYNQAILKKFKGEKIMKIIKKILSLVLVIGTLAFAFASCGDNSAADSEYVKNKGTLIVGITEYAPMDYKENNEWIGFDADMAKLFAEYLGVKAEFFVISDWDYKTMELETKGVDVVWNGMTLTDGVKNSMATSNPYCKNAQVVVVNAKDADKYNTIESLKDLSIAVENGSAGAEVLKDLGYKYTAVEAQSNALMEVAAGTSDACVIDLIMAGAMIGEGTSYPDLVYTVSLTSEEYYGVGFRKGSDLCEKLNDFFKEKYADGTMTALAEKYGVNESLIPQK